MEQNNQLSPDKLQICCTADQFDFETTAELEELTDVIGQERAISAVEFGVDIDSHGYNIFALGTKGTGKEKTTREYLKRQAAEQPIPNDWIYVNNFENPDNPRALQLPTGVGKEFRNDMREFVNQLKTEIPQAFDSDEYKQEQQKIRKEFEEKRKDLMQKLEDAAQEKGFTVVQTPGGPMLAPLVDGEVMTPDQFGKLEDDRVEEIETKREDLEDTQQDIRNKIIAAQKEAREQMRELDRRIITLALEGLIESLREQYSEHDRILNFLDEVMEDLLDNVQMFKQLKQKESGGSGMPFFQMPGQEGPNFDKYRVNLLTDNSGQDGAPVVYESNPTYYNLLGRIEHEGRLGELTTDFTMIKEGALHRANGGYLIIEVKDILTQPFAWEGLKRALKNERIKTESMGQEYRAIQTRTLEPETIPLDVNVVLLGNSQLYYLLYNLDEDFQELFKVKADFADMTDRTESVMNQYAQFIATLCEEEGLNHFNASGVARIVEEGIRRANHQKKISTQFRHMADVVRQASYWSDKQGKDVTERDDVKKAIDEQVYRSNRIEERIQELIEEGTILIDSDGEVEGQVNGLSVLSLGDYEFGKPSRITARVHAGQEGVINIERKVELGGRIHNKGVMILSGYLGGEFAQDEPLALSASLTFEQTYSEVDGDSASSTELYALLSSLSGLPIRQDLAVTGSINQRGEVQAIGGVNEKVEGFFKVCKLKGLTGDQGVIIPASNVKNLMVREEVVNAVEEGKFHIYPVETVDRGIELLTGVPAGERQEDGTFPEDTVKGRVARRLEELSSIAKEFGGKKGTEEKEE